MEQYMEPSCNGMLQQMDRGGSSTTSQWSIAGDEVRKLFREVHVGECGKHQGNSRLYKHIVQLGYYWPTMEVDDTSFLQICEACQVSGNRTTFLQLSFTVYPPLAILHLGL